MRKVKMELSGRSGTVVSARRTRRLFLHNFVLTTAISTLMGNGWVGMLLADCQPTKPGDGVLRVNIADFPALQHQNGSVRLAFNPFTVNGPTGAFYPVLINRGAEGQFFTLSTQCQHLSCVVPTYNAAIGAITCSCHGSKYSIEGEVLQGPATRPLLAYPNSFDGAILCVEIPNLGFQVTGTLVQSGVGPRFELRFPTKSRVSYQVLFRQSVADPGTIVPFATTSGGAATSTAFTGNGSTATLFVDRANDLGIYSITVPVKQQ
jgi:nitrite reductase/ring-hydroxylating ferredoxin subunit